MTSRLLTAPLAAAGLIAGFAVALASGSRPLGGFVLAAFGIACITVWRRRDGTRTAALLTVVGVVAFALSHLLGLVIGAWPAVIAAAATVAGASWRWSDARVDHRNGRETTGAESTVLPDNFRRSGYEFAEPETSVPADA